EIDANGLLNVSAQDKATGYQQQMRITPTSGLAPDEIDALIDEATRSADKDQSTKQVILLRNRLESLTRNTQRTLREIGALLTTEQRQDAHRILAESEESLQSESFAELELSLGRVEQIGALLTAALLDPTAAANFSPEPASQINLETKES
ncbi:MAG: Hsp70 family protein, partial [Pyrinomonadaceae bacterium]